MKKRTVLGVICGIILTEVLDYFAPSSAALFYGYVFIGALTASALGRRFGSSMIIAGYVVAWKIVGMILLMQTYGSKAILSGVSPFLIDWTMTFLVCAAGGYAGSAWGRYAGRRSATVVGSE